MFCAIENAVAGAVRLVIGGKETTNTNRREANEPGQIAYETVYPLG